MVTGPNILERVRARLFNEISQRFAYLGYWDDYYMQKFGEKVLFDYMASVRPVPYFSAKMINGSIEVKVWFSDEAP